MRGIPSRPVRRVAVAAVLTIVPVAATVAVGVGAHAGVASGVVTVDEDLVTYTADGSVVAHVVVSAVSGKAQIRDYNAPVELDASATAAGCRRVDVRTVSCPVPDRVHVLAGSRDDYVQVALPVSVVVKGGDGHDTIDVRAALRSTVFGEGGDDTINGSDFVDVVQGGPGRNTIYGHGDRDVLSGGSDPDTISGGAGEDNLFGFGGTDVLRGGPDADQLFGGDHADRLLGEAGTDRLYGNAGADLLDAGPTRDNRHDGGPDRDKCVGSATTSLNCES